jgi:hypothetical protein
MDIVHKHSSGVHHVPSSESFEAYLNMKQNVRRKLNLYTRYVLWRVSNDVGFTQQPIRNFPGNWLVEEYIRGNRACLDTSLLPEAMHNIETRNSGNTHFLCGLNPRRCFIATAFQPSIRICDLGCSGNCMGLRRGVSGWSLLRGSIDTVTITDAGREAAERPHCLLPSYQQIPQRRHDMHRDKRSFGNVAWIKYLKTRISNQNLIEDEIRGKINSGKACCHSVQKSLSSHLLCRKVKIRIYETIILPVVLYECETWSVALWEEHRVRAFDNWVLVRMFG